MVKPHFSKEPYAVTIAGDGGTGGGAGGMRFISGEGEPGSDVGAPGDIYLDTDSGDLYKNSNGTWAVEINLKGDQGSPGKNGSDGEQGPSGEDGADGKQGPAGSDGKDGADGFPTEEQWDDLVAKVDALEGGE